MGYVNIQITVQYVEEAVIDQYGKEKSPRKTRDERFNLTGDATTVFERASRALGVFKGTSK